MAGGVEGENRIRPALRVGRVLQGEGCVLNFYATGMIPVIRMRLTEPKLCNS